MGLHGQTQGMPDPVSDVRKWAFWAKSHCLRQGAVIFPHGSYQEGVELGCVQG